MFSCGHRVHFTQLCAGLRRNGRTRRRNRSDVRIEQVRARCCTHEIRPLIEMAARSDVRNLEYTLAAVALFSAYVVYSSDPSGFGPPLVGGVAYLWAVVLLIDGVGFAKRGRLSYLLVVVSGIVTVVLLAYLTTGGNGSPVQGSQVSYSCTAIQVPNATSPTGFTGGIKCTGSPYYNGSSVLYNVAFWTPIVGSIVYATPSWIEPGERNVVTSCSRNPEGISSGRNPAPPHVRVGQPLCRLP